MAKIKLGIINSSPLSVAYGGVAPFIKNLDPFLQQAFDVEYITLPMKLHDLKFFPRRLTFLMYLFLKKRKFKKYDAVLSHVPEGSYIVSFSKTPLIHIFHGNFNAMSQSRFWYGKYFTSLFQAFENRIIKKAKLKYTVGMERPGIPKILNPIHHNVLPKPPNERAGFIFAGRLEKIKNIDKIIRLYSLLPDDITNIHPLYIAGTGSQEQYLKKLAADLNLTSKVIFTGELLNDKLIEEVSAKKILCMASSQEGLPMAIAEALSVGLPVISTDTGDISRAVKNNFNGFLLPVEFEPSDYAEKIKIVLNNYEMFSANALASSEIFRAKNVAHALSEDIIKMEEKN